MFIYYAYVFGHNVIVSLATDDVYTAPPLHIGLMSIV